MKTLSNISKNNHISDIEKEYNNNIKFVINPDDRNDYKKMLLEYPYSYFNKFSFTKTLNDKDNSNSLKQIHVIDYDYIRNDPHLYKTVNKLFLSQSKLNQFIFVSCNTVQSREFLKEIKSDIIIMHNIHRSKSLQKYFYKNMIKVIVSSPKMEDYDEYKKVLTTNDVNTVIINNGVLKYN